MPRPSRRTRTLLAAAAALSLAILAPRAGAQPTTTEGTKLEALSAQRGNVLDEGTFVVSQNGKAVRLEDFAIERMGDTLVVRASSQVALPGAPARPPDKSMVLMVGPLDFAMGSYWSMQTAGPDTLRRGIEVTPGDTSCTVWRELDRAGSGDQVATPPGRLYVLDPPLFTSFNFIGRSLQGKSCDRRPINVFVLGVRDSLVAATVTDAGEETLRWAGRPVQARKLVIADEQTSYTTWFTPDGRMLRLEQPRFGIRVDRKQPPLKARPPTGDDRRYATPARRVSHSSSSRTPKPVGPLRSCGRAAGAQAVPAMSRCAHVRSPAKCCRKRAAMQAPPSRVGAALTRSAMSLSRSRS
jgi:hypothetical protein